VISEKPLQAFIQTRNLIRNGWSAQIAHDGQYKPRSNTKPLAIEEALFPANYWVRH